MSWTCGIMLWWSCSYCHSSFIGFRSMHTRCITLVKAIASRPLGAPSEHRSRYKDLLCDQSPNRLLSSSIQFCPWVCSEAVLGWRRVPSELRCYVCHNNYAFVCPLFAFLISLSVDAAALFCKKSVYEVPVTLRLNHYNCGLDLYNSILDL